MNRQNPFPYEDILQAKRPEHNGDAFSVRHPKMTVANRAKIFAPFSALKGLDESMDTQAASHEAACLEEDRGIDPFA